MEPPILETRPCLLQRKKDLTLDDLAGPVKQMAIPQQGSFLQFFHSFSRQFFGVLTLKEMLPYFVFYQYLAVFSRFSLEWLNDAFFGKEMTVGLGLGLFCSFRILEPPHEHIAFRQLPFPIGQACAQVYLAANFGSFELRMFPWSPSEVEAGTFQQSSARKARQRSTMGK